MALLNVNEMKARLLLWNCQKRQYVEHNYHDKYKNYAKLLDNRIYIEIYSIHFIFRVLIDFLINNFR